jgi:GT2 family glycosyltransferase
MSERSAVELSPAGRATSSGRAAVVVVNWNGREDTLACLASLQSIDYAPLDVLVVDNGSTDGSVPAIRAAFPRVGLIETGRNLGFAGGNNAGIEAALAAGADFVLLLNNDTVVSPGLLRELIVVARSAPDIAAVSPKIYYQAEPKRVWYAGSRWVSRRATFEHIGQDTVDSGEAEDGQPVETEYACGCAMLLPAAALRRVGLLDDALFLLYEETDWCFRARRAGLRCLFAPRARLWHKVSASFGGRRSPLYTYFDVRNRLLWAERHLPPGQRARVWLWALGRACEPLPGALKALALLGRLRLREAYWEARDCWHDVRRWHRPAARAMRRATWQGVLDYLRRRFGDCPPAMRTPSV